ncbi:hypothetical protein GNI_015530 [Gregarina niphandrodes]|uniref:Uncharacterized protein n=1 Tax=Gregarina niphandrodes TaxID=110365 RepID=A0A023BCD0_GRENI|nr:hypothetical protein GNI_015530 [Gregarina niphandrodes]EZG83066.1 hypothetical protein GNI_015530 [Gregarina niphandrodes]|eukprot:XP_011128970.1 hypothetical protein GNI_015530 [Gregarina niphandrodes]
MHAVAGRKFGEEEAGLLGNGQEQFGPATVGEDGAALLQLGDRARDEGDERIKAPRILQQLGARVTGQRAVGRERGRGAKSTGRRRYADWT